MGMEKIIRGAQLTQEAVRGESRGSMILDTKGVSSYLDGEIPARPPGRTLSRHMKLCSSIAPTGQQQSPIAPHLVAHRLLQQMPTSHAYPGLANLLGRCRNRTNRCSGKETNEGLNRHYIKPTYEISPAKITRDEEAMLTGSSKSDGIWR
jgi:hypothetical protein